MKKRKPYKLPEISGPLWQFLVSKEASFSEIEIFLAIQQLSKRGESPMNKEIADTVGMHRTNIIYHATNMIKKKLIKRDKSNRYSILFEEKEVNPKPKRKLK